jgi:hypothetical protein
VENGRPVVVIQRYASGSWRTLRAQVHGDGTIDNASLIALDLPPGIAAVDRRGDELFAVILPDNHNLLAARLDAATGKMLWPAPKLIATGEFPYQNVAMKCNVTRCAVRSNDVRLVLDADGNQIAKTDDVFVLAAADRSFLAQHCFAECTVDFLSEDGAVKSTFKVPAPVQDAIYDGSRYVVLLGTYGTVYPHPPQPLTLYAVDPVTGAWSSPKIIHADDLPPVRGRLAWNGSMYAVAMIVSSFPAVSPIPTAYTVETLRVGQDLAPLDAELRLLTTDTAYEGPLHIVGTPDGFLLIDLPKSMPGYWTSFIRNDGTIEPKPPLVTPLLRGAGSQTIVAGASSRASRLAVWTENDGPRIRLLAGRRARTGELLDAKALTLANAATISRVSATSDGDGFLVAWTESAGGSPVRAAMIDAAGNVRAVPLDDHIDAISVGVSFDNGAYQLTSLTNHDAVDAFTVSSAGVMLLHDRVDITRPSSELLVTSTFDGRRIAVAWAHDSLWTVVKDVQDGAKPVPRQIIYSSTPAFIGVTMRPDGAGGYFLLYAQSDAISSPIRDIRTLVRLSGDGKLLPETSRSLDRGLFTTNPSILRIGGQWYATWNDGTYTVESGNLSFQVFVPFDGATLAVGRAHESSDLNGKWLVPGWNGEALLLFATADETELGPVARATMQVVVPGARGRAVGH